MADNGEGVICADGSSHLVAVDMTRTTLKVWATRSRDGELHGGFAGSVALLATGSDRQSLQVKAILTRGGQRRAAQSCRDPPLKSLRPRPTQEHTVQSFEAALTVPASPFVNGLPSGGWPALLVPEDDVEDMQESESRRLSRSDVQLMKSPMKM